MLLFWDRGYEATSLEDLTEAMGLSLSSLYAAFGDKERLYLAAIDRYLAGRGGYIGDVLERAPSARIAISRLLEAAAHELTRKGQPRGSMICLASVQCAPGAAVVQTAVVERRAESIGFLERRIERGLKAGEFPAGTTAAQLAAFYMSVLQGMSIQARDGASRATLLSVAKIAMRAWPDR
jgi:AcrR family transcriptional regulator